MLGDHRPATTPIGPVPTQQLPVYQPVPPPLQPPGQPSFASYVARPGEPTPSLPPVAYPPPGRAYPPGWPAPAPSLPYAAPGAPTGAGSFAAGSPPPLAGPTAPTAPSARPRSSRRLLAAAAGVGLAAGLLGGGGVVLVDHWRASGPSVALPAPAPGTIARPDGSIAKIAAQALPSVVTVKIRTADGAGNGSGFVIDTDGHILTNNHVVADAEKITVETQDGRELDATVVGRDSSYDLAVLSVTARDLTPLPWGRSADVVVGDGVIAVGAPLGLDSTVTSGIVSALNRPVAAGDGGETSYINAIQTDAAINPGNSGGPLVDSAGRVIGVNSAIASLGSGQGGQSGSIGLGFAIPVNQAKRVAEEIISTGRSTHPIMGVSVDLTYTGPGAQVKGVTAGGPAAAAGLGAGDVVVSIDGRKVSDSTELIVAIRSHAPGDTVQVEVKDGAGTRDVQVTLAADASAG